MPERVDLLCEMLEPLLEGSDLKTARARIADAVEVKEREARVRIEAAGWSFKGAERVLKSSAYSRADRDAGAARAGARVAARHRDDPARRGRGSGAHCELTARPRRPASKLAASPPSTQRVLEPDGCARAAP